MAFSRTRAARSRGSRVALVSLVVPLAAALLGSCGGDDDDGSSAIPQPEVASSQDGTLRVTLRQAPATITVAGKTFVSNVFNGTYVPPVLKLRRGERLELTLSNRIGKADVQIAEAQDTNLHYHGMSISPKAPADDIFLHIANGADYQYSWAVPATHPQGAHWYHPHPHGFVEPQILSGMSGMLLIDGVLDHFPAFVGLPERYFLLKDIQLPGADDSAPLTKTINGVLGGTLRMRPGEMQVWHLGNVGADAYFHLAIDQIPLWELSRDGNLRARPERNAALFLPPGARSTAVIQAPDAPGRYAIRTLAVDTGPQGDPNPEVRLATLIVEGDRHASSALRDALTRPAVNVDTLTPAQVEAMPITRRRTVVFSETADGNTFFIDGKVYDPARDDITVNLGDVEEWTLRNVSGERHVFHIHQLDFLVTSINQQDPDETGLRDVVDLPYQQNGVPGEVTVIIPFTDPLMVGRFVFHCHIVGHEDGGMMANVVVLPPGQSAASPARMRTVTAAPPAPKGLLARWLDAAMSSPVPRSSPWDDALCRAPSASAAGRVVGNAVSQPLR